MSYSARARFEGQLSQLTLASAARALGAEKRVHRDALGRKTPYLALGTPKRGTLVFLHGFSDRPEHFLGTAAFLRDRYRILVPAMPGFHEGFHEYEATHEFDLYSEWMTPVVSDIAPSRFHLMGNSLGGATALGIAARLGGRIASLTLVDSAGVQTPGIHTTIDRYFAHGESPFEIRTREDLDAYFGRIVAKPLPVFELVREHMFHDMRAKADWYVKIAKDLADGSKALTDAGRESHVDLGALRMPTLVVWGEHDALFPAALAEHIGRKIAGSEVRVLSGVGHCPHLESPRLLAKTFDAFVARQDSHLSSTVAPSSQTAAVV